MLVARERAERSMLRRRAAKAVDDAIAIRVAVGRAPARIAKSAALRNFPRRTLI